METKKKAGPAPGTKYNMMPPMLRDLRWAYKNVDAKRKGTPNQEHFRRMYKNKPAEFIAMMDRLERLHKSTRKDQASPAPATVPTALPAAQPVADLGEAKCVELVERLLGEAGWRPVGDPTVAVPPGP